MYAAPCHDPVYEASRRRLSRLLIEAAIHMGTCRQAVSRARVKRGARCGPEIVETAVRGEVTRVSPLTAG